jgi:hypothetical protein
MGQGIILKTTNKAFSPKKRSIWESRKFLQKNKTCHASCEVLKQNKKNYFQEAPRNSRWKKKEYI